MFFKPLCLIIIYFIATQYLTSDLKSVNISIFRANNENPTEIDLTAMYETLVEAKIELLPALSVYLLSNVIFTRIESTDLVSGLPE